MALVFIFLLFSTELLKDVNGLAPRRFSQTLTFYKYIILDPRLFLALFCFVNNLGMEFNNNVSLVATNFLHWQPIVKEYCVEIVEINGSCSLLLDDVS